MKAAVTSSACLNTRTTSFFKKKVHSASKTKLELTCSLRRFQPIKLCPLILSFNVNPLTASSDHSITQQTSLRKLERITYMS